MSEFPEKEISYERTTNYSVSSSNNLNNNFRSTNLLNNGIDSRGDLYKEYSDKLVSTTCSNSNINVHSGLNRLNDLNSYTQKVNCSFKLIYIN